MKIALLIVSAILMFAYVFLAWPVNDGHQAGARKQQTTDCEETRK